MSKLLTKEKEKAIEAVLGNDKNIVLSTSGENNQFVFFEEGEPEEVVALLITAMATGPLAKYTKIMKLVITAAINDLNKNL